MNAEFNLSMLKCIYAMLKNFTGNAIKAECILRYTYNAFSPATCDVEHAFLNYYADRMLMSDHPDFGKIGSAFRDFKEDCNKNAIDGNIYLPEMFDSDAVYGTGLHVRLLFRWLEIRQNSRRIFSFLPAFKSIGRMMVEDNQIRAV